MLLKKKVEKWLTEGIISAEQAEAILSKEKSRFSIWSLHSLLTVAGFSIGLGVLSLVSANWAVISDFIKLFIYFLLMGSFSILALKLKHKSDLWFESLLILVMFLCFGGIGLIAQIYNLEGESWQSFFLWSVMTSGLMLVSKIKVTSHIWMSGFYLSLFLWACCYNMRDLVYCLLLIYFLFFMFISLLFHIPKINFPDFVKNYQSVFENWTVVMGLISLISLNIASAPLILFDEDLMSAPLSAFFTALMFLFLGANVFTLYHSNYKKIQKILLTVLLGLYILFFIYIWSAPSSNNLSDLLLSLLILFCAGFFGLSLRSRLLFKWAIAGLIVRLFIFYVQTFKGLILTGIGLIAIGLLVFYLFILFERNKESITQWIRKLEE